jgi:predicted small lipoprotein YifL
MTARLPPLLLSLLIAVTGALAGCGQKGDLYLPDETPQQDKKTDRQTPQTP